MTDKATRILHEMDDALLSVARRAAAVNHVNTDETWLRWWAWYPVRVPGYGLVWWEWIERRPASYRLLPE